MSKHTPGPWAVFRSNALSDERRISVSTEDGSVQLYDAPLGPQTHANARLIAAAPEMYELLKLIEDDPSGWCDDQAACDRFDALMASLEPGS